MTLDGVVIGAAALLAEVRDRHPQSAHVVILLDLDTRPALQDDALVRRLPDIDDQRDTRIVLEAFVLERGCIGMKRDLAALVFVPGRDGMRRAIGRGARDDRDMRLRKERIDFLFLHRHDVTVPGTSACASRGMRGYPRAHLPMDS